MNKPTTSSGAYEPDPAAEVAMLVDAFFAALGERFPDEAGVVERLHRRQERLVAAQQDRVIDAASRYNLAMTLAVVAAYQELESSCGEQELVSALRAAFVEPTEPFVRSATRSMLDGAPDPFAAMVSSRKQGRSTRSAPALSSAIPTTVPTATPLRSSAASTTTF